MYCKIPESFEFINPKHIVPEGWIGKQLENDAEGFAGRLDEIAKEAGSDIFGCNRISEVKFINWWNGESEGNWIDGAVRLAYLTMDETLLKKVNDYMDHIMKTRGEGGYLGVYGENLRFGTDEDNGELWCQSRIYNAMLAYYMFTGKEEILEAVVRAATMTTENYGPYAQGKSYFNYNFTGAINGVVHGRVHGLMIVEPMLKIYELTGNIRFLDFARFCYDDYSSSNLPWDCQDCQLDNLLIEEKHFLGHGPHTCEQLRIPLMIYYYTGEEKYKQAYTSGYKKMQRYTVPSGAVKSDEWIGAEKHSCLPLPTAGYEYCTITEQLFSLHCAIQFTGNPEYADMAELLLFNSAQASRSFDGKTIAYLGADNQCAANKALGVRWDYSPTQDDTAVCCVPNAGRTMPYHVGRMWMKYGDIGLAALFYGPCTVSTYIQGIKVVIQEITDYPFEETVRFRIKPASDVFFNLKLRIPQWSKQTTISINGVKTETPIVDLYCEFSRVWKPEDMIEISFEAGIETVKAADGTIAVKRGPLVYSLKIPEVGTKTKTYAVEGFCDIDYAPVSEARLDYTLLIDEGDKKNRGITLVKQTGERGALLWDNPPIQLKVKALDWSSLLVELDMVPIGSTILRKTCFNHIHLEEVTIHESK